MCCILRITTKGAIAHTFYIKGDLLCKNHFYKVFEHSCVAAVCENNQPIMLKILVRSAFKVQKSGRTSSTHAQNHQLDLRGLKKLPALGRGVQLSASPLDDENYVIRTVDVV